ncbi:calmodulin-binding 60 A-like isoform X1 [Olea europaea subsp. europaea]|uniref:Calmodulin-binding 60 A-like isoform X1 n=1 Tax=Olea europaea subsp. europaea TaxID=158383 RepID=A0A8S0TCK7_OLEEU|nr:calmodulin-binding 60 A-like isoform X1 [Olea europaea subsp. europaea]
MRINPQMGDCNKGESEGVNRLESDRPLMALREYSIAFVENCIRKVGIYSFVQDIKPVMDDLIRKRIDKIQLAEEKSVSQNWNSIDKTTTPIPRVYKLKFLDKVSDPVYIGTLIKGKEGTDIKVALFDDVTEAIVDSGPESSATVEILFLDAVVEDFNNSIIIENNNPYFRKPIRVNLEKGIGILPTNIKLGHNSQWIKRCQCRLGARVEQTFDGSRIKEASTESFTVLDRRSKLYKKHEQPSPSDKVWRLTNISKNGARHNRLRENNISTVQEFLSLLSVDPQRLQKIFRAGPRIWEDTVDHARKCSSSSECKNRVVFDVGQQKGALPNDSCVPIDSVADAEMDDAWKSPSPAFENQSEAPAFENLNIMASFNGETSSLHNFPSTSNDKNATNSTGLNGHLGQYLENEEISNEQTFESPDNGSNSLENSNNMASFNEEDSFQPNLLCTSNDENAANSTGLDGHSGQYVENAEISNEQIFDFLDNSPNSFQNLNDMAFFDDADSSRRNFSCTSNDENAANSTGLNGHLGQYLENEEISNEQTFESPDNGSNSLENSNNMASFNEEDSFQPNLLCTSNDENAANSTGLDGHSGQYVENAEISNEQIFEFLDNSSNSFQNLNDMAFFDDEDFSLRNFSCTSNDKNAANSTGLDGHLGQFFENEEISNEPRFEFPFNNPYSFSDALPLWNFDDRLE